MWLLNTASYNLELIDNLENCPYAILSHTWERGEVTFQEIANLELARQKPGFSKIERTCQLARERGIKYVWVDTCCIDKSSSAELNEAINSMFRWYKNSAVCFVFLCDLPIMSDVATIDDYFPCCRWFTRGWTLQELIASKNAEFYDLGWNIRGDKLSLHFWLSRITGIDVEVLKNSKILPTVSVARRMSWAATRVTSRPEDRAYSLFGIFDVYLPLIYGEGSNAFIRLQEAIAQDNDDMSLFAWVSRRDQEYRGLLARSPLEFKLCGDIHPIMDPALERTGFSMSNRGFHIKAKLFSDTTDILLSLQCIDDNLQGTDRRDWVLAIRIVRTAHGYVRHQPHKIMFLSRSGLRFGNVDVVGIHIPKDINLAESQLIKTRLANRFRISISNTSSLSYHLTQWPSHLWNNYTASFSTDGYEKFTGLLKIHLVGFQDKAERKQQRKDVQLQPAGASNSSAQNGYELGLWDGEMIAGSFSHMKDRTSDKDRHSSEFLVVFGLEPSERTGTSENIKQNSLKPWAALYDARNQNLFSHLDSKQCQEGFPHGLNEIRELVRGGSSAPILPKMVLFTPILRFHQEERIENSARTQIQVSISTEIIEDSVEGMFRLILKIESKD